MIIRKRRRILLLLSDDSDSNAEDIELESDIWSKKRNQLFWNLDRSKLEPSAAKVLSRFEENVMYIVQLFIENGILGPMVTLSNRY